MTEAEEIGERLKLTRLALGFNSQDEFVKGTGLTQNQLSQYETGTRRLTLAAAMKLHRKHGISMDWLFFDILAAAGNMAPAIVAQRAKK